MTSTSASPETYRIMESQAESRAAITAVLQRAQREIAIFDLSPESLKTRELGRPHNVELLRALLLTHRARRVRIVLHETQGIETEVPRLVDLLSQFSGQVRIHRSLGAAREAQDVMIIADDNTVWRKPVASHPRAILSIGSTADARPFVERFADIWDLSELAVFDRASGL